VRFSDRLSAFVVDLLLLGALQFVASLVLSRLLQAVGLRTVEPCDQDEAAVAAAREAGQRVLECEQASPAAFIIVAIVFVAVTVGYHAFFEGRFAATPGKRMAGLAVANADGSPGPIGLARGFVRSLVRQSFWWALLIVLATSGGDTSTMLTAWFVGGLALGLVSWVSAATSTSGWSLHDSFARSRVVSTSEVAVAGASAASTVSADAAKAAVALPVIDVLAPFDEEE